SLTEGAGKLLNYMAVGLPTVAFDTPVAHEYLGADGLFAERGDAASLAERLEVALREVDATAGEGSGDQAAGKTTPRGAALRQRALEHFDWLQAGEKIIEAYAHARGDAAPAPRAAAGTRRTLAP
ncbi:MAG: glycosyltransferase, partial [Caldilineaceae bacterium]